MQNVNWVALTVFVLLFAFITWLGFSMANRSASGASNAVFTSWSDWVFAEPNVSTGSTRRSFSRPVYNGYSVQGTAV